MADPGKDPNKDRRQKAADARAAALAAEKRRERTIRIIGAIVVVVVVVGIIGGAIYASSKGSNDSASPDANAATPTGVNTSQYFYPVNAAKSGVPTVRVYEDFQCPYCKKLEESSGLALIAEAKQGKLNLEWQPGIFMDANLKNQGSLTATSAWGCAINAGKGVEFHEGVFKEQSPEETVGAPGFTQQQMLDLGKTVGITGTAYDTFQSCVTANTYNGWAANSNEQFAANGVSSTPSIFVNGKELPTKNINIYDPKVLIPAVYAAAK